MCADARFLTIQATYSRLYRAVRQDSCSLCKNCLLPGMSWLCNCLFMPRSGNRGLINQLSICWCMAYSFAERVVRIRIRWRIVSVHRQRRQVRIVSVITTPEPAHDHCSRHLGVSSSTLTARRYCRFTELSQTAIGIFCLSLTAAMRGLSLYSSSAQPYSFASHFVRGSGAWLTPRSFRFRLRHPAPFRGMRGYASA